MTGELGEPQIVNPILTNDYKQAYRTLDLLRELGELTMLSGHGIPWKGDMNDAVNIALESAIKKQL